MEVKFNDITYNYDINYDEYVIEYYEKILTEYKASLFTNGLSNKEYNEFLGYYQEIYEKYNSVCEHREKLLDRYYQYENLHSQYYNFLEMLNTEAKREIKSDELDYILHNTNIIPLVFANKGNEEVDSYSNSSHHFLCNFHHENTPSLGVTITANKFYCFGCGAGGNQLSYLKDYEKIFYREAIYLLAEIYMIELEENPYKGSKLVKKYQDALVSAEYLNFINKSYDRYKKIFNSNSEVYDSHLESIERIRNGIRDNSLNHVPKRRSYTLKLEKPF